MHGRERGGRRAAVAQSGRRARAGKSKKAQRSLKHKDNTTRGHSNIMSEKHGALSCGGIAIGSGLLKMMEIETTMQVGLYF